MAITLTFAEVFHYDDDPTGITLSVTLRYRGQPLRIDAKVDPGAAVCLFKRELGEELGIPVEQGKPITLETLNGSLEAFGHEVILQTGDLVFESIVYFAKYPGLRRNLLGREGWLRKSLVAINDNDCVIYLNSLAA